MLFGVPARSCRNLCETLMKHKAWGSFFGAQGAHFRDLGRKKAPPGLTFHKGFRNVLEKAGMHSKGAKNGL